MATQDTPTAPTPGAPPSGSVEEAAARFERALSQTGKQRRSQAAADAPEAEAPEVDAEDLEPEAPETSDEAPEGAEEDGEEGSTEAPEDKSEGEDSETKTYTVKVDGKDVQVTMDELLKGYSRTADYTRKTEALAQARKAFAGEAEAVKQERQQYAQLLPALVQQLQASLPRPPDPALREQDPLAYVLEKERYEDAVGRMQAGFSELQRVQQAQQSDQVKALRAHLEEASAKLPDLVPAWKDKAAYERDRPKVREYLKSKLGYSDEEINQAYDHRAVAAAYKAMKYDELLARRPSPGQPLEKVLRPGPAPAADTTPRPAREAQAARKRLAETGKVEDAALAIRALL